KWGAKRGRSCPVLIPGSNKKCCSTLFDTCVLYIFVNCPSFFQKLCDNCVKSNLTITLASNTSMLEKQVFSIEKTSNALNRS
ncbi:hypothetical protein L9F63_001871, partial [Diploptera punctata]